MKKFLKNNIKTIVSVIITAIVCISTTAYATLSYSASQITYKNTTLDHAIDDLYSAASGDTYTFNGNIIPNASTQTFETAGKRVTNNVVVNPIPSNYKDINNATNFSASDLKSGAKAYNRNGELITGTASEFKSDIYNNGTFGEGISLNARAYHAKEGTDSNEGVPTNPTITYLSNSVKIELNDSRSKVGQVYISNVIDFSKYDLAVIHVKNARVYDSSYAYQLIRMEVSDADSNYYNRLASTAIVNQNGTTGADVSLQNSYRIINLSNINTMGYLNIYIRSYGTLEFDKILLIKL